jgi:hypothetical protein
MWGGVEGEADSAKILAEEHRKRKFVVSQDV